LRFVALDSEGDHFAHNSVLRISDSLFSNDLNDVFPALTVKILFIPLHAAVGNRPITNLIWVDFDAAELAFEVLRSWDADQCQKPPANTPMPVLVGCHGPNGCEREALWAYRQLIESDTQ
jgi:hypothetical protein